jgi:GR25 family glycosyltransferase involved in LPS biosynthesis
MSELSRCQFYCLSYYKENIENMKSRFKNLDIECKFYSGVRKNNEKIKNNKYNNHKKRQLSMMYGHLNIFKDFYYNTNSKYAVICEDDIIIHKDIKDLLHKAILDLNILNLDILLLSYMIPYKIKSSDANIHPPKIYMSPDSPYKYYDYPYCLSGTQMYMIKKEYAKYILDKYYHPIKYYDVLNFSADKVLIHNGNKALIYPMLAIENENQKDPYHKFCHKIHYDENYI